MEELNNLNKNEFLSLCKKEFETYFADNTSARETRYFLAEAARDAVVSFKQEHDRWPKVFEFLQYVSRMFAIHAPRHSKKNGSYSYYKDKNNTTVGDFFRDIAKGSPTKVLNRIAYDIQHHSTHTHCVKLVKSQFNFIRVHPNDKYYRKFPDEIPEYVMLNEKN